MLPYYSPRKLLFNALASFARAVRVRVKSLFRCTPRHSSDIMSPRGGNYGVAGSRGIGGVLGPAQLVHKNGWKRPRARSGANCGHYLLPPRPEDSLESDPGQEATVPP